MHFASSYWPAGVPNTLWQFDLLVPESRRNFPFVGIAVTWEFVVAFIAGCILICVFAWKRFEEPSYDVKTPAFRDFSDFRIWNLKDSVSLRRAYVVYCISLVSLYAAFAFFGRIIVQLANQLNVAGLQIDVGIVDFSSWKWPLALAIGIAGFGPLLNPLVPVEFWMRRFSHEVVGIPTRIREKSVRIRTLIDGAPSQAGAPAVADWVRTTLGARLDGSFVLRKNLQTIIDWSYDQHVKWSDPEIRSKLNEYEREIRGKAEAAIDDFDFLTRATAVTDAMAQGNGQLHQYEKRLTARVAELEESRDKFAIVLAVYCEHGSRFEGRDDANGLKKAIRRMSDVREPPATGLPLYCFLFVFIAYALMMQWEWHPLISTMPLSNDTVAVSAALETLKVFLLVWLPPTAVAAAASVIGPEPGERPVNASSLWEIIPGAIAAFAIAAIAMGLYATLYASVPASNVAQMRQSLLGRSVWTGALPYYLWFAPVAVICFAFVSAVRFAERPPSTLVRLGLAACAAGLVVWYLGRVVSFTAPAVCQGVAGPVTVWAVLWRLVPPWSVDLTACFSYYSTLDILVIAITVFLSVFGLARTRIPNPFRFIRLSSRTASVLLLTGALGIVAGPGGGGAEAKEVVLGFRKDIRPFSFLAPAGEGSAARPYFGYIADLCYEIFDRSPYDIVQVPVTADNRFAVVRPPSGNTWGPRLPRADGSAGPPDSEERWIDVLCDAATIRLDDRQRMEAGVFSPVIFTSGVSYLQRSRPRFREVEVGYVENSTAKRVAMEACAADAMRLGDGVGKFACEPPAAQNCLAAKPIVEAQDTQYGPPSPVPPTRTLHDIRSDPPKYVDCPLPDHKTLIRWFCGTSDQVKVYFGDREIILANLEEWVDSGKDCGSSEDIRDPHQFYTYEPYALLVSTADPELAKFVQKRVYELFSHAAGARALFAKWFPDQSMSEPLAWLFLLNGVMEEDELLAGPKQFPNNPGAAAAEPR